MSPNEETDAINHADAMDLDEQARKRQDAGAQESNEVAIDSFHGLNEGDWIKVQIKYDGEPRETVTFVDEIHSLTTDGRVHTKGGEVVWRTEIIEVRSDDGWAAAFWSGA